jgi:hypothetical protein
MALELLQALAIVLCGSIGLASLTMAAITVWLIVISNRLNK